MARPTDGDRETESARLLAQNTVWQELTEGTMQGLESRMDALPFGDDERRHISIAMTVIRNMQAHAAAQAAGAQVEQFNALALRRMESSA